MKLYIRAIGLFLLLGVLAWGCTPRAGAGQDKLKEIVVDSLQVEDIPNDGGDGLIISWKPLEKDKRIQEYRIYRGVHPDTLFFLASVPVNVKTGVTSERMYYYDSGYNPFIDLNSPGKLKNEKSNPGSILYQGVPRDVRVAARLSGSYDLISSMEAKDFYHHATNTRSAKKNDDTAYAGMKLSQQTILASLKSISRDSQGSGQTPTYYYYTVVPVNEREQYLGIHSPVRGYAIDNRPEQTLKFNGIALMNKDKGVLQFEWDLPVNNSDLAACTIYRLPRGWSDVWSQLSQQQRSLALDPELEIATAMGGVPVGGGSLKNYTSLEFHKESTLLNPSELTWEDAVEKSCYVIQYSDYSQGLSYLDSLAVVPVKKMTSDLPQVAQFRVEDKPMDKGDRLTLTWEQPIVIVTNTTAGGKDGSRLKINYQVNKTDAQKIQNIFFEFFEQDSDKPFAKVNEFHLDNIIKIRIPAEYSLRGKSKDEMAKYSFKVKMTIATKDYEIDPSNGRLKYAKAKKVPNFELMQYLKPDPVMMAYMPTSELWYNGVEVSSIKNVVYRKSYRGSSFTLVKRNTVFENSLDVTIPYVSSITKQIVGFNYVEGDSLVTYMSGERFASKIKKGEKYPDLGLVPSDIDLTYDEENKTTLSTSVFLSEARQKVARMNSQIRDKMADLIAKNEEFATLNPDSPRVGALTGEIAALKAELASLEKQVKLYEKNPEFNKSLKFSSDRGMMNYVASIREPETRRHTYMMVRTDGKGSFVESPLDKDSKGNYNYYTPISNWFDWNKLISLFAVIIFGSLVVVFVNLAKRGKDLYMRPIAGLEEIDNAVGRATEMGRPMLYCMGNGSLSDVATLASMGILSQVAKKAAEYDTKLIVPCYDYIVMPIAQEIVREAHYAVGRPDSFDKNNVFYLTSVQFAYVAGVNGIMIREKMATNFFMGYFAAEALLMTETGNAVGAVQIAGSDAITQIPFFITTCDYTLIGEELYAASAYLNREPMLLGTLKGQDYFKFLILVFVFVGAILATFQVTGLMQIFPLK